MKVTYIISNIDYALEFDWIAQGLSKHEIELQFIFINQKPGSLHQRFLDQGMNSTEFIYTSKRELVPMVVKVRRQLKTFRSDIVHCHLFEGSLTGLLAARLAGVKHRIYTRHHSNYHHVYAPRAVKFDKLINRLSTRIISISEVVSHVLTVLEGVKPSKLFLIEHGIAPGVFTPSGEDQILAMKEKYQLSDAQPVIGCISRLDRWKGVNYIIDAFARILKSYPNATLLIAHGAGGDDREAILQQIDALHLKQKIRLIPFEKNINTLYDCMDLFVHAPIDQLSEAFGQIYVEAMYKRIPIIATRSGVGNTVLTAQENTVAFKSVDSIEEKMLLHLSMKEQEKQELLQLNFDTVKDHYVFSRKEQQLTSLYKSLQ